MRTSSKPTERMALVAAIDPDNPSPGAVNSGWVDASKFRQFLAVVQWGVLGTAGTIDAKIQQATDSSGTSAKDVSGTSITQVAETTSPTPDDQQAEIQFKAEDLDQNNAFTHVRLQITVGDDTSPEAATSYIAGLLFGLDARHGPASDDDASSVAEIVG